MLKEVRTWYCDACGKELVDYIGSINVIEFDDDGNAESVGYDFCMDCMKSFVKWKESRKGRV